MNTLNKMLNFFFGNGNDGGKVLPFDNIFVNNKEKEDKVKEYFEKQIFKNISNITNDNITNDNSKNLLTQKEVNELVKKVNGQCQIKVTHNPKDDTYTLKSFGVELRGKVDEEGKPIGTWTDGYREFEYVKNDEGLKFKTKQDKNGSREPCDVKFTGFKGAEPSTFFGKVTRFFTKPLFLGTFTNQNPPSKNNNNRKEGTLVYYAGLAAKSSGIIQDKNGVVSSKNGSLAACYLIENPIFDKRIPLKNLPNQQDQQNTTDNQPQDLNTSFTSEKTIGKTQANNNNQPNNQPQDLNKSCDSINSISTQASDNDPKKGGRGSNNNEDFNKKYEKDLCGLIYDPLYEATNNNRLSAYSEQAQNIRNIIYGHGEQIKNKQSKSKQGNNIE
jgi:hypothetical protein